MVEVTVARLGFDTSTETYVVILREKNGQRLLPVWIRHLEAEAINDHLNGKTHPRPLTHDLCKSIIVAMGGSLAAVHITHVLNNTYYAELHIHQAGGAVHVDARPSDSIAIALRFDAPIFAPESLLTSLDIENKDTDASDADAAVAESERTLMLPSSLELNAEQLKAYLEKLRPEDFGKFMP